MGKLIVYLALCFLVAFIVIPQLPAAAADVGNEQSLGEEMGGTGRKNGDVSEESNGPSTHKKFVRNYVPRPVRKILKALDDSSDEPPPNEPPPNERYDCESETVLCEDDPDIPPDCGPNPEEVCDCILGTHLCTDSRFLTRSEDDG